MGGAGPELGLNPGYHLPTAQPRANHFTFLRLSFLIFKMGMGRAGVAQWVSKDP